MLLITELFILLSWIICRIYSENLAYCLPISKALPNQRDNILNYARVSRQILKRFSCAGKTNLKFSSIRPRCVLFIYSLICQDLYAKCLPCTDSFSLIDFAFDQNLVAIPSLYRNLLQTTRFSFRKLCVQKLGVLITRY